MNSAAENMARMNDAARRLRPAAEAAIAARREQEAMHARGGAGGSGGMDPGVQRVMRQQRTLGGRESCCG